MKNSKKIIIVALLVAILIMAVGYAALSTQLTLNATANIISEWNVKITEISAQYVSENCVAGDPQFTNTTVTFNAGLTKPGDYITYLVTIQNAGTIDAVLKNFTLNSDEAGSPSIIYTNTEPDKLLKAGQETCFLVKVSYDENATEIPSIKTKSITGIVEYVQK